MPTKLKKGDVVEILSPPDDIDAEEWKHLTGQQGKIEVAAEDNLTHRHYYVVAKDGSGFWYTDDELKLIPPEPAVPKPTVKPTAKPSTPAKPKQPLADNAWADIPDIYKDGNDPNNGCVCLRAFRTHHPSITPPVALRITLEELSIRSTNPDMTNDHIDAILAWWLDHSLDGQTIPSLA